MTPTTFPSFPTFLYNEVAFKVALSTGIGLLIGLEREWAQKEIGARTFALCGLLGMLVSLLSDNFVIAAMAAVVVMICVHTVHSLLKDRSLELTTSICLIVVLFLGALVGEGHFFTASSAAIIVIMLLAWKLELERFAGALRPEEIRSAVLLGLLSIVIYPLLPDHYVDRWQLLNPQQYWVTVMVIAGIGFLNYALLRIYSTKGMYYAAVLGGLVNSTAAAAELSAMFGRKESEKANGLLVSLLLLTNVSMFVRNGVILAIFAREALWTAFAPLSAMALTASLEVWLRHRKDHRPAGELQLSSPVSLKRVFKFGVLFLVLACAGTLAQRYFGSLGFLAVSVLGGLVSSASTTATAATLMAAGNIDPATAGLATVLTSVSSALVNMPLVYQQTRSVVLTRRLATLTLIAIVSGLALLLIVHKISEGS